MAELTVQNNNAHHVQIGDTDYEIESVYGNKPLDEILAAYICEKKRGSRQLIRRHKNKKQLDFNAVMCYTINESCCFVQKGI